MWGHLAARCPQDPERTKLSGFVFVFSSRFGYNAEQSEARLCGIGEIWGHLAARCPQDRNVSRKTEEK